MREKRSQTVKNVSYVHTARLPSALCSYYGIKHYQLCYQPTTKSKTHTHTNRGAKIRIKKKHKSHWNGCCDHTNVDRVLIFGFSIRLHKHQHAQSDDLAAVISTTIHHTSTYTKMAAKPKMAASLSMTLDLLRTQQTNT